MLKKRILISWLGLHDLDAEAAGRKGPIASILLNSGWPFNEAKILVNAWFDRLETYEAWLKSELAKQNRQMLISFHEIELESPIDYPSIYQVSREQLDLATEENAQITLNLTSGTPAMVATWLLLGKGVYDTDLVQTSLQSGLLPVQLPFDISLAYLQRQDSQLHRIASSAPDLDAHFERLQAASDVMQEAVELAKRVAVRDVPVIIQGETGTGKEVFAQAIHKASIRAGKAFIAVNCGAIPESLIDSQLFGHKKGAFTGAVSDRKGFFDEADGGTLFLDEIGELPLDAQSKLLRALQQKEVTPVGASKPHTADVRVVAATHRDLLAMIEKGRFREDLFYRLAVGIIQLPPLRDRREDIAPLAQELMESLNQEAKSQPGYKSKKISQNAIEFIEVQPWPGNIRELWNTLLRASIWSDGDSIDVEDLHKALIQRSSANASPDTVDVSQGVDLKAHLDEIKTASVKEALRITAGQKGRAAKLLGLSNHQTLTNWMKQLGIPDDEFAR